MATATRRWTLDELHALPDDGNRYEVVRGELFVTPAPARRHELILARLARILDPYVEREHLGFVLHRAVIQYRDSQAEPDLTVQQNPRDDLAWASAPTPTLVVEVFSASTKRRDENEKRDLYRDAGVGEYWMVDPDMRAIIVSKGGRANVIVTDEMAWRPEGASAALVFSLARVFGEGEA